MNGGRGFRGRTGAVLTGTALAAVLGGSWVAPASAAPAAAAGECPAVQPVSGVSVGTIGEGRTVVTGTEPQPFRVEVLGVLDDGIGAGRDLVMIKVSDLPGRHVIDQGGGIWDGMSGSPVYVGGKLLGAVSYGFTFGASPIGGLTPAEDMTGLLGGSSAVRKADRGSTRSVALPTAARRGFAARAQVATPRGALEPLTTPLAVSGLRPVRLQRLQKDATAADLGVRTFAAGRAGAATAAPTQRPVPGGNFAAVLSYGDVTAAGIGTTTYVCGDQALAFGHPLQLAGPSTYGANGATSLAIVRDDASGSFKMANVGPAFGTVDQDRTAALRADLTRVPGTATVTTTVRNHEAARTRTGVTQVVSRDLLPGLVPDAVWANFDSTFDEVGDGRLTFSWTISGTRAGGKPFSVSRVDKWADREDVGFYPAVAVADAAYALSNNDLEDVTITKVAFSTVVSTTVRQLSLTKVEVSVNGGAYKAAKSLSLKAGDKLAVRSTVKAFRSTATAKTVAHLTVPKSARGRSGALEIVGGMSAGSFDGETECLVDDDCEDDSASATLDQVKAGLQNQQRNDDVVASLRLGSADEESDKESDGTVVASGVARQREVVAGTRSIEVEVRR